MWRNDFTLHKRSAFFISEQEIATDILGLEYKELKAKVKFEKHRRPHNIPGNYVCISIQSSSQAKYWNYPNGWQTIVDYIKSELGYSVVCIDKDEKKIKNLKKGLIPIFEPGLDDLVKKNMNQGRLKFDTKLHPVSYTHLTLPTIYSV